MTVQARETEIGVGRSSSDILSQIPKDNPSADCFQGISTRIPMLELGLGGLLQRE
ncbi:hypothetical protein [Paenibacillus barengoltzii]|uniref:hypothetical protein n=1 Tax=Paenibacillus barengoltzii TaxID=343517 RepID=UPI00142F9BEA|nr:hypothetical protein [Paenibacillus barengoltzii]